MESGTVRGFELKLFLVSTFIFSRCFPAVLRAANDAGSKESRNSVEKKQS